MARGRAFASVLVLAALTLTLYGLGFWVLWHSLLTDAYGRPGLDVAIKDYYLGDQFAYLAISSNVMHGRSAFVEPYTATGSSIYPSGYFWLVGRVASAAGTTVFGGWNLVGIAVDALLFAGVGGLAWIVTRNRWAWVLGPVPVLIGTYQYWTIGAWRAIYGAHAVLWPAAATLFSPGAEPAALLLTGVAVACLTIESRREPPARLALAAAAGAAVGLTLYVHTYVAILAAVVCSTWFLVRAWELSAGRTAQIASVAGLVIAALVIWAVPDSFPLLRVVVVIGVALLVSLVDGSARRRLWPTVVAFGLTAGVVALPMLLRIASQVRDSDSFLYQRQASGVATDLSLPFAPTLLHSAPILLLAGGCLVHLLRSRSGSGGAEDGWIASLIAIGFGSALLVANQAWGLQQEAYRFLPYGHFLVAAISLPWLVRKPVGTRIGAFVVRGGTVVALAATVPTTLLFARETPAIRQFPAAEQAAFRATAEALPHDGLVLLDSCLPRGAYKASTGAKVVGLNEGLAYPEHAPAIREVLSRLRSGAIAGGRELDAAGVRSFVTVDGCSGPTAAELEARFGAPRRRVELVLPPACGLPPLEVRVYERPLHEDGGELTWEPAPATPGEPLHPWAPCASTARTSDVP